MARTWLHRERVRRVGSLDRHNRTLIWKIMSKPRAAHVRIPCLPCKNVSTRAQNGLVGGEVLPHAEVVAGELVVLGEGLARLEDVAVALDLVLMEIQGASAHNAAMRRMGQGPSSAAWSLELWLPTLQVLLGVLEEHLLEQPFRCFRSEWRCDRAWWLGRIQCSRVGGKG